MMKPDKVTKTKTEHCRTVTADMKRTNPLRKWTETKLNYKNKNLKYNNWFLLINKNGGM